MNINTLEAVSCQRNYWAKMTRFKSGHFEMSVVAPRVMPEPKNSISVPKGCLMSFAKTDIDLADIPAPVVVNRVRKILPEDLRIKKDEDNLARTVRRARGAVRRLIKGLEADHMLTFSYRENMIDIERLKADWKRFLRMMRGRYPKWQFVCVREQQERGAYHLHVAVKGKQDIRWILRCWLLAIGQDWDEVAEFYIYGNKLGEKSKGAVNVRAPSKRWGGNGQSWKPERLAGYLTKYLGKEFQEKSEHYSMRYWHSKEIDKPQVVRFWLGSSSFEAAIKEAHDCCYYKGAENMSFWKPDDWENLYICGDGLRWDFEVTP